ncbi:MAG: hypothetical protein EOM10_12800, partial [Opitutae bacterium]|nr:hypothetical protein [Opitutae bacterium]
MVNTGMMAYPAFCPSGPQPPAPVGRDRCFFWGGRPCGVHRAMSDIVQPAHRRAWQPLSAAAIGGPIGRRIELTWRNNILALDWERDFLAPFRAKEQGAGHYVGLGKTLEGLVRLAAYTRDDRLGACRRHALETLFAAQGSDGYLGTYRATDRIIRLWDVHEQAYLLLALVTDWTCFHDERSLSAATRLGACLRRQLPAKTVAQIGRREKNFEVCSFLAVLGLDRAFLALHKATGDDAYLNFCVETLKLPEWDQPIVEGRSWPIEGHMYACLTRCLAQLDLFDLTGDKRLLAQTRRVFDYLRGRRALVISGTNGIEECWHSDQTATGHIGETCATAYLIRMLSRLLQIEGGGWYGDWIERAIYNALFAAQSPDGRRLRYYVPLEGPRKYFDRDTYCCPGNFRRIIAELPDLIAYRQADGIALNLYAPCEITTQLADDTPLVLRQDTDYPSSGRVRIELRPARSVHFTLRLRQPGWCAAFSVSVNGQAFVPGRSQHFLELERDWQSGDCVELDLPMPWRLVRGFRKQAGKVAVMRGPQLFACAPTAGID